MDANGMSDLERLVAIEEIKQLKARYCRAMDEKRWNLMREVFTTVAAFGPFEPGGAVHHGADEIARFLETSMESVRSVHQAYMPEITVTGPTSAHGTWAMRDLVETAIGEQGPMGFRGFGYYEEEYRVEDGAWRIDRLRLPRLQMHPLAGGYPPAGDAPDD